MPSDDTNMGGPGRHLPTTCWSDMLALAHASGSGHVASVNSLIQKYWKPVYCYFRRCGLSNEEAKDLTQRFFVERDVFRNADPSRGRFRAFLFSCLDNFRRNVHRAANAKRRRPPEGIVSIEDLLPEEGVAFEVRADTTPEDNFSRDWITALVRRVLDQFQQECRSTGKQVHYALFRERIVRPALDGAQVPPMDDVADDLGLTQKQACNRLLTARRAFQRLLREEIRAHAASDDEVAEEVGEVFAYFARGS